MTHREDEELPPRKLIHDSRFDEPVKEEPRGPVSESGMRFRRAFDRCLTALRRGRRM